MSVRSFRTSSIRTGEKRSKFWDQSAVVLNPAFESIASSFVSSTASSIVFDNIPQGYSSLQLRIGIRLTQNSDFRMRFNNDTSSIYNLHFLRGNGATVAAGAAGNIGFFGGELMYGLTTANILSVAIIDIHDYASTSKNTTVRVFFGADYNFGDDSGISRLASGLYVNTASITRVDFFPSGGSINTGSIFSLYGIKAAA